MAQDILNSALAIASKKGIKKISRIKVKVGETRLANKEYLERGFEMVSSGSPASGARLKIEVTPLAGRCKKCKTFLKKDSFSCPSCASGDIEIASGQELLVEEVE